MGVLDFYSRHYTLPNNENPTRLKRLQRRLGGGMVNTEVSVCIVLLWGQLKSVILIPRLVL